MMTACWNVFMLPISIAFQLESEWLDVGDPLVDVCFLLDIVFTFRTTILDEESGDDIKDTKIIAKNYLKGRFTVDFLSTLPFD